MGMIRSPLTDLVGFKGMPAGYRDTTGLFREFPYAAGWWTASDTAEALAWGRMNTADYMSGGFNYRLWEDSFSKQTGLAVRFVEG
jgi:hypothetical protein